MYCLNREHFTENKDKETFALIFKLQTLEALLRELLLTTCLFLKVNKVLLYILLMNYELCWLAKCNIMLHRAIYFAKKILKIVRRYFIQIAQQADMYIHIRTTF